MPPNTVAPCCPFPNTNDSSKYCAGASYHSFKGGWIGAIGSIALVVVLATTFFTTLVDFFCAKPIKEAILKHPIKNTLRI